MLSHLLLLRRRGEPPDVMFLQRSVDAGAAPNIRSPSLEISFNNPARIESPPKTLFSVIVLGAVGPAYALCFHALKGNTNLDVVHLSLLFLRQYGDVLNVILCSKKRGSAVVEFASVRAAVSA